MAEAVEDKAEEEGEADLEQVQEDHASAPTAGTLSHIQREIHVINRPVPNADPEWLGKVNLLGKK